MSKRTIKEGMKITIAKSSNKDYVYPSQVVNINKDVITIFGPMKKAEKRALETGEVFSKEAKEALVELPDEETKFEGKIKWSQTLVKWWW